MAGAGLVAPPKPGAKSKGKTTIPSDRQNVAFDKAIDQMMTYESKGATTSLKVAWTRGQRASNILDKEKRDLFGVRGADEIAKRLGVGRLTVHQCMKFFDNVTSEQVSELCDLDNKPKSYRVPSWRTICKLAYIKDDVKRGRVLNDILSGNLDGNAISNEIRGVLKLGPKKTRKPSSPQATFNKISANAGKMSSELTEWVPRAATDLQSLKDTVMRRDAKKIVDESIEKLQSLRSAVETAISDCQKLLS